MDECDYDGRTVRLFLNLNIMIIDDKKFSNRNFNFTLRRLRRCCASDISQYPTTINKGLDCILFLFCF